MSMSHDLSPFSGLLPLLRRPGPLAFAVAAALLSIAGAASGQDEANPSWTKVETAPETRTFKEAIKAGTFDATSREYLESVVLPQFEAPANRLSIERMRKRFRENLLADIGSEKAANDVNAVVLAFLQTLAGKDEAEPVARVNGILLIGELQGSDRKPWTPAVAFLVKTLADDDADTALRIAALIGLARHVDSAKASPPDQQRLAAAMGPAITSFLKQPARGTPEHDWIVAKCLGMLPLLGPASPETMALVLKVVEDGSRPINTRVRAAKALADLATPAATINVPVVTGLLEKLAIESLERDVIAGDQRRLERQFGVAAGPLAGQPGMSPGGFGPPAGMVPGMIPGMAPGSMPPGYGSADMSDPAVLAALEQTIPREVCRRAAWRLATLADAVLSDGDKRGVAAVGGQIPAEARELAQKLRRCAMDLDATPDEPTLRQALVELKPPDAAAADDGEAEPPPKQPAAKAAPKAAVTPTPKPAAKPAAPADADSK